MRLLVKQTAGAFILAILGVLFLNPMTGISKEKTVDIAWYEASPRVQDLDDFAVVTEPMCGGSSCKYAMTVSRKGDNGGAIFQGLTDTPFVKVISEGLCLEFACQKDLDLFGEIPRSESPCLPLRICKPAVSWKDRTKDLILEGEGLGIDQIDPNLSEGELGKIVFLAIYYQGRLTLSQGKAIQRIKARLTLSDRSQIDVLWKEYVKRFESRVKRLNIQ